MNLEIGVPSERPHGRDGGGLPRPTASLLGACTVRSLKAVLAEDKIQDHAAARRASRSCWPRRSGRLRGHRPLAGHPWPPIS
ncbi:MAG: hypothetical protein MZW92_10015 [Comamonadaceae bacterium]|nr:hypothetical protein [Comamonadaceae bacterium]